MAESLSAKLEDVNPRREMGSKHSLLTVPTKRSQMVLAMDNPASTSVITNFTSLRTGLS
jgi:hypothetical protein